MWTTGGSGLFTSSGTPLTDGSRFMVGSQEWEIDYDRTSSAGLANFTGDYLPSSRFVAITAVPEPSTFVLIGIGLAGLRLARRCKWGRLSLGTQDGAFPRRTIANCTSGRRF